MLRENQAALDPVVDEPATRFGIIRKPVGRESTEIVSINLQFESGEPAITACSTA